jgi:eukaryotic-like serine/threonine-protein kinase
VFFKNNTLADVLKHLAVIVVIVALMLFFFFFVYLPITTNHGETIQVPNIKGMKLNEVETLLEDHNLRHFVSDSSYDAGKEPFVVMLQDPAPGSRVKEGRKIYITYNMKTPPNIKMPKLIDMSVNNAQMVLKSFGLKLGEIREVPDLAMNSVLKQLVNGKEIAPGAPVAKGSVVDLVVGNGVGNTEFQIPNVVGMPVDEASTLLVGAGLQLGITQYITAPNGEPDGTVVRQRPVASPGAMIRVGELVDIWVAGPDPVGTSTVE